jgi:hypothetical protein
MWSWAMRRREKSGKIKNFFAHFGKIAGIGL